MDDGCFKMAVAGIADITRIILEKNPSLTTMEQTRNEFFELNPDFRHDQMFLNCFPAVYGIHVATAALAKQEKERLECAEKERLECAEKEQLKCTRNEKYRFIPK